MSAHTPGKWEVISDPGHFDTRTTVVSKDGGSRKGHPYRMTVQVGGWERPREAEANARLIAAAPDLLEACQTFAEWLRREEEGLPDGIERDTPEGEMQWRIWWNENMRICDLAQEQVRTAIAKATGGAA